MRTYILQVRSGMEEHVCRRLKALDFEAFVPMKKMLIRNGGTWHEKTMPVFSQYVFLKFVPDSKNYHLIHHIDGFVRFLGSGAPQPVSRQEEAYIAWLRNDDKPIETSKVYVSPSGAKMILSGALRKYQGSQIEYHLRQHRAVVYMDIMGRKRKLVLPVTAV